MASKKLAIYSSVWASNIVNKNSLNFVSFSAISLNVYIVFYWLYSSNISSSPRNINAYN